MKDKRQGNDLKVAWSIFMQDGEPFRLDGKDVSLYLKNMFGRKELSDFVTTGNIIQWTFYGKDQKNSGKYSLELVINEGEKGMITTDKCDFVNLVSCSCKLQGGEDAPNVETESIELTSTLEYVAGGGSYDDTALWNELENKVDKEKGKGLSSNDYTNADKQKLAGLKNYDDTAIKADLAKKADKTEIPTKLSQLEQDIEIGGEVDLSDYPTREEVSETYLPREEFEERIEGYATADRVQELSENVTELSTEVSGLSERVENLEQGGQGGGTPSGDPMHYMFEAVGATYNATGADIPMVGIYGDSYVHKAKHWHLNELGDITSEEMREIYAESFPMRRRIILESAFANTNIRTNIPIWKGCDTTAYGSDASTKVSLFGLGCDCSLEVFAWVVDSGEMMNIVKHLNLSSVSNLFDFRNKTPKIKKVLGEINLSNISSTYSMFSRCTSIEEIRLYKLGADLDIKLAPRLSYASIKFLLANSNATSKKTLTLHATALANAEAAYLADVEQDTTTYPTLSDWALSKNIQIATA